MFKNVFRIRSLQNPSFCGWFRRHDRVMWWFTLPKTNIAPENRPSQPVFPPSIFRCKLLSFREGHLFIKLRAVRYDICDIPLEAFEFQRRGGQNLSRRSTDDSSMFSGTFFGNSHVFWCFFGQERSMHISSCVVVVVTVDGQRSFLWGALTVKISTAFLKEKAFRYQ